MVRSMKPQGSRRAASVAAGRGAAAVARAESKTEAYARIREQRAKTAAKRRREEAAAEAGGVGQFLSQAVGALDFQEDVKVRRPFPRAPAPPRFGPETGEPRRRGGSRRRENRRGSSFLREGTRPRTAAMVRPRGRCTGADRPPGFLSFLQGDRATLAGMRKMRKGDKMSRDEYNALKVGLGPIPARGASTAEHGTNVLPLGASLSAAEGGRHVRRVHRRVGGRQRKIHRGRCAPTHPRTPPFPPPPRRRGRSALTGNSRRLRGGRRRLQLGQPTVHPRHRRPRRRDRPHPPGHQLRMDCLAHPFSFFIF